MLKLIFSIISLVIFFTTYYPTFVFGSTVIIFDTKQYDKNKGKPVIYTDTFSTRDPSAQYTLHVWQGVNGQNMAKNGNITLNGIEVVSARELTNTTGYISKTITLQLNNTLSVKLKGKSGVFLKVKITGTGGTLPNITISSPLNGDIVNRESVMITGAAYSPLPEISVKVNGKLAEVTGGNYFVNNVPLQIGQNTITATLTEKDGYMTEEIITILTDTQSQPIKLTSNITGGVPPLSVYFMIGANISSSIISYNMDFDGDGTIEYSDNNADNISFTYNTKGIYFVEATVIDDQNNSYTDSIGINVISKAAMDAKLQEKWSEMKTALSTADLTTALSYFSEGSQEKYSEIFGGLSNQMTVLANNMQNIELIYVKGDLAKYRIYRQQDVNGTLKTITYYIYFIKDKDGFWKIRSF